MKGRLSKGKARKLVHKLPRPSREPRWVEVPDEPDNRAARRRAAKLARQRKP